MATLPVDTRRSRPLCALSALLAIPALFWAAMALGQALPGPIGQPPMGPSLADPRLAAPSPGQTPLAPPLVSPGMTNGLPRGPLGAVPGSPPAARPPEEMVVEVRVEGNKDVTLERILSQIHTRAGRPYDLEMIEEDVRRLNKTRLFVTVRPLSKPVPGGRLVIFQVVERPLFSEVKILGTDKAATLKKEIGFKKGDAADPLMVEEGRRKIEDFYHNKGYSKVRVTVIDGNKPGDLRAIYLVNEGPKQRILWVNVVGNTIVSEARIKAVVVKSKPPILYLFKGEVDRKQIDEDVDRITAYYRGLGFFRARVSRELSFSESQNWLVLTFFIDEGPRYLVRNVSFVGNKKFPTEQLREKVKLRDGQYFNQAQMTADVKAIQDKYGAIGHVFADIKADPRFLDEPGKLDLVYNIDEGARYRVGRINIEIKGENPHTKITTVLNRLSLHPGDVVDTRELHDSERRLKASGLFMVDPQKNAEPRIVIKPPELEEKQELADRPKRQSAYYRGPDPATYDPRQWPAGRPLPPLPPGERYLDVVALYENADDYWHDQQDPDHGDRPDFRATTRSGGSTKMGLSPSPVPAAPSVSRGAWRTRYGPAPPPDGPVPPMEMPLVVRGQYTGGEGGFSTPDLPARTPAPIPYAPGGYASQPAAPPSYQQIAPQPAYQQAPPGTGVPSYSPQNRVPASFAAQGPAPPEQVPSPVPWPNYQQYPTQPAAPPAAAPPGPTAGQYSQPAPQYAPPGTPPGIPAYGSPPAAPTYGTPPGLPAYGSPAPGTPMYGPAPGAPYPPGAVAVPPPAPPSQNLFGVPDRWLNPTPSGEPMQDVPIRVLTDEAQTGRLMFGVGVNSDAGLMGSIVLDEQNFDWTRVPQSWEDIRNATAWRGAGQRFRVEAVPGTQVQRYMINFQEPYFFFLGPNAVSLGLSGFYYDRIFTEWRENRAGGRISLGYQLTHDLTASVAFRGMNVNINSPEFPDQADMRQVLGSNALYGFGVQLAHDTRDNAFLATEGHLFEISFEEVTGSFTYPHTEMELSQYFKLYERPDGSGRHVLSLSARAGISGDNTPIFERYYAGGFSTLRGFRFRGVSPFDPVFPMAVGGDFELLATIQYLFPITADDMLRGVVFCDTGTVEPTISHWNQHYRVAPGFGLRIVIPMMGPAPIALDFAFPVAKQSTDETEIFSFFVGFNR